MPKVSIIVPHFNQAAYIHETIESVCRQTYSDWECVVVDDGSEPMQAEQARQIVANFSDQRISFIALRENAGVVVARQQGVKATTGPYLLFLDGDDAIVPNFLSETAPLLDREPLITYVYTQLQYFGARNDIFSSRPFYINNLLFENFISVTSLMRRLAFERVGGFNTNLNRLGLEDWDLFLSMTEQGYRGMFVPKPLVLYRQDPQGRNRNHPTRVLTAEKVVHANHPKLFGYRYWVVAKWRTINWIFRSKILGK